VGYSLASIKGLLPTISEEFARMVADDPVLQEQLRPAVPFANTVTGGVADLSANISTDLMLLDKIQLGEIRLNPDTLGLPFHWVAETGLLAYSRLGDSMFVSCAVQSSKLYTRNIDGSLIADLGAISINAPFIPVIAAAAANSTLPFQLEGSYIEFGAARALHILPVKAPRRSAA
jgi:hypothetical protein